MLLSDYIEKLNNTNLLGLKNLTLEYENYDYSSDSMLITAKIEDYKTLNLWIDCFFAKDGDLFTFDYWEYNQYIFDLTKQEDIIIAIIQQLYVVEIDSIVDSNIWKIRKEIKRDGKSKNIK